MTDRCPFCEAPGAVWIILGPGHARLVCPPCADRLVTGRFCFIAAAKLRRPLPRAEAGDRIEPSHQRQASE